MAATGNLATSRQTAEVAGSCSILSGGRRPGCREIAGCRVGGQQWAGTRPEQFGSIGGRLDCDLHEAVQHLLPGLLAVVHVHGRIRIERVVDRIVEVPGNFDHRAFQQQFRGGEIVVDLPAEVILRHAHQNFTFA